MKRIQEDKQQWSWILIWWDFISLSPEHSIKKLEQRPLRRQTSTSRLGSPDRKKSGQDKLIKAASPPPFVLGLWFCLFGGQPDR